MITQELRTAELHRQAAALYGRVFGYTDPGVGLSPPLLATLLRNGGTVVGSVDDGGVLRGFAYGIACDGYHFSQAAVVDPALQGRGLGRELKRAQAGLVRAAGVGAMRWAFDPRLARNAHFNLSVLGATGRWYVEDYFFRPGSDRIVVEWDLTAQPRDDPPPAHTPTEGDWGRVWHEGGTAWLAIPNAQEVSLREPFEGLLAAGYRATGCVRCSPTTAAYRFTRQERA